MTCKGKVPDIVCWFVFFFSGYDFDNVQTKKLKIKK